MRRGGPDFNHAEGMTLGGFAARPAFDSAVQLLPGA